MQQDVKCLWEELREKLKEKLKKKVQVLNVKTLKSFHFKVSSGWDFYFKI